VRCGLLGGVTVSDPFAGLLSAMQAEWRCRCEPIGQDREGSPARLTDSATHPDALLVHIVGRTKPSSMTNDCAVSANRTSPRQPVQRDHPGSTLSFASASAIKRITAGVRPAGDRTLPKFSICWPGLHPPAKSVSNENKNTAFCCWPLPSLRTLAALKASSGQKVSVTYPCGQPLILKASGPP
jgi:hypothetical protein